MAAPTVLRSFLSPFISVRVSRSTLLLSASETMGLKFLATSLGDTLVTVGVVILGVLNSDSLEYDTSLAETELNGTPEDPEVS